MPELDIDHSAASAQSHRLPYLDGWRGICIIMVLLGHFSPVHFIDLGSLGVEMFFVLSGRLMADILFIEKFPLKQFYIRRFSRVWPGLFIYTVFCGAIFLRVHGFLHVGFVAILAALTFTTNYKVIVFGQTQLLDHTWSLCVEEHSYIILGVLAFFLRKQSVKSAKYAILLGAILASANGMIQSHFFLRSNSAIDPMHEAYLYGRSDIRCASVLFSAFIYLQMKERRWIDFPSLIALSAFLIGVFTFSNSVPEQIQLLIGTICLSIAVSSLDMVQNKYRKLLSTRILMLFGTYSFSIYIWQQLFYKIFQDLRADGILTPMEGLIFRPAFVIGACAFGMLSYYFVEAPARRYINKNWAVGSAERNAKSLALISNSN
jgi:peptidoglycan/LPS O-acetylase OafA/YrhL